MRSSYNRFLSVVAFIFFCNSSHAQNFDIVGLKLGMTVAEARAALLAYGVDPAIEEQRQYYTYSDGVNHNLNTEDFVTSIGATRQADSNDNFSVFFSPGPQGGRVVAVIRTVSSPNNPPVRSQYRDALIKKYGSPTTEDMSTIQWDFPAGKIQCIAGPVGTYLPTQPSILKKVYQANLGSRDAPFHHRNVQSLSDCSSYLTYAMPSGDDSLVNLATAVMVDVGGTAEGELAANEWVAGLAEAARNAQASQGAVPDI